MLYNDFLGGTSGTTWQNDLQNYPQFASHLKSRFGNLELLHDDKTTLSLLENVLIDYGIRLRQAEMLARVSFDITDLGVTTNTQAQAQQNTQSTNTLSYTGYNVDADYNRTTNNGTGNSFSGSSSNTMDKLKETLDLNNYEIARIYDSVDRELYLIFRVLY